MPLAIVTLVSIAAIVAAVGDWIPGTGPRTSSADEAPVPSERTSSAPPPAGVAATGAPLAAVSRTVDIAAESSRVASMVPAVADESLAAVSEPATIVATPATTGPPATGDPNKALVRENRELAAEVAALEAETMEMQSEMLALDLQIAVLEAAKRETASAAVAGLDRDEPDGPIELGNTTLVPPPPFGAVGTVAGGRSDDVEGFLPQASSADVPMPELGLDDPTLDELVSDRSTLDRSVYDEPAYEEPLYDEPTYAELAYEEPLYDEPAYEDPAYDEPAYDEPAYEDRFHDEPSPDAFADERSFGAMPRDESGAGRALAAESAGAPIERLTIADVPSGSVAEDAGLLPGDVLLGIDGLAVIEFKDVYVHDTGDPDPLHDVEVLRDRERRRVTLAASPLELSLQMTWIDPAILIE